MWYGWFSRGAFREVCVVFAWCLRGVFVEFSCGFVEGFPTYLYRIIWRGIERRRYPEWLILDVGNGVAIKHLRKTHGAGVIFGVFERVFGS